MINADRLLRDLQRQLRLLESDLRERSETEPAIHGGLEREHAEAKDAGRTAKTYDDWRDERVMQAAVAWLLACVFVRFSEDNGLVDTLRLAGPGERLELAQELYKEYFGTHKGHTDREWLLEAFRRLADHPAAAALFDQGHNPLWRITPSADAATALLSFWQRKDPDGRLVHDFTDPRLDTRFLGDLYQDLSQQAKKSYALLQTPEFVERFLLDHTLEPALEELPLEGFRLIDPACGSGHLLLGAFHRLLDRWRSRAPDRNGWKLVQNALDSVYGVDVNPFAVAIARFRLTIAALKASGLARLADAPGYRIHLAVGDSLLHGRGEGALFAVDHPQLDVLGRHYYSTEDGMLLQQLLNPEHRYHVVVGNPPYITPKDKALNEAYRRRYAACSGKYALTVPFIERFFDLAQEARGEQKAGYVGLIAGNAFMKRDFGKKLIEQVLPHLDLTHVVDTSGAYIPGHGTPTVILFGRHRPPSLTTVRVVMGIRGEPFVPKEPAYGVVWRAIHDQVDHPGSASAYVSVADLPRVQFNKHPWSIGGGRRGETKTAVEEASRSRLKDAAKSIGITSFTLQDDLYLLPRSAARRRKLQSQYLRPMVIGDRIRDWTLEPCDPAVFPYDADMRPIEVEKVDALLKYLWPARTTIANNVMFGGRTKVQEGLRWSEYGRLTVPKLKIPLSIAFAFVATHNYFVLDRGGKVFNRSAPVIKLPEGASEDDHLRLLGLLNSSTACFWLKQVSHDKGNGGIGGGIADQEWERFYEFTAKNLERFPLPADAPLDLARRLDALGQELLTVTPRAVCERGTPTRDALDAARARWEATRAAMIALQEELDWEVYRLYGLLDEDLTYPGGDPPGLRLGERAFEIVLARRVAAGEEATAWFERHRSTPRTEVPGHWPEDYQKLVARRIELLGTHPHVGLIERPEHKRRWATEPWEAMEREALREWLLDRLERPELWLPVGASGQEEPRVLSVARLADLIRGDEDFLRVMDLYVGRPDYDLTRRLAELVEDQAVPYLAALRYSEQGMRKRRAWEEVWALQRREDAGEDVGTIPVPPRYRQADFAKPSYWRLRGRLDVPKERFILYPLAGRPGDPTPVLGWAGWDHLRQAQALATLIVERREHDGGSADDLKPLLAGLMELEPWVRQWHPDVDPAYGMAPGDFYAAFLDEQLRSLGLTREELAELGPHMAPRGRRRHPRRAAAGTAEAQEPVT